VFAAHFIPQPLIKMITAPTNISTTTPTNTYLWWARISLSCRSAQVINAPNPDRERRTKAEYKCNTTTGLKTMRLTCGWKYEAFMGGQSWRFFVRLNLILYFR